VKVLDFGLAKHAVDAGEHTETVALTAADARTEAGQMIGTVAYMSPEQAEGKHIDVRSDVFVFGVVLYEMVSGCRPFQGESTLSTLASILQATPEPLRHHRERIPDGGVFVRWAVSKSAGGDRLVELRPPVPRSRADGQRPQRLHLSRGHESEAAL
jgi:serine/threonine protein kinase